MCPIGHTSLETPVATINDDKGKSMMFELLDDNNFPPNNLTFKEFYQHWTKDSQAFTVQKERIEKLIENNHGLMCTIHELKKELKASRIERESMTKLVHMLNSSTDDLNKILSSSKQVSDKRGIRFNSHVKRIDKGESS